MSNVLTRDAILQAPDLQTEEVAVAPWGGSVLVRGLTGAERDAYEASMVTQGENGKPKMRMENMRAKLVALCVVDETGKRLFTQADAEALGKKSGSAIELVAAVARRLSGLSTEDVEVAVKN